MLKVSLKTHCRESQRNNGIETFGFKPDDCSLLLSFFFSLSSNETFSTYCWCPFFSWSCHQRLQFLSLSSSSLLRRQSCFGHLCCFRCCLLGLDWRSLQKGWRPEIIITNLEGWILLTKTLFLATAKPVCDDYAWDPRSKVIIDSWSLFRGSICYTNLNSGFKMVFVVCRIFEQAYVFFQCTIKL